MIAGPTALTINDMDAASKKGMPKRPMAMAAPAIASTSVGMVANAKKEEP